MEILFGSQTRPISITDVPDPHCSPLGLWQAFRRALLLVFVTNLECTGNDEKRQTIHMPQKSRQLLIGLVSMSVLIGVLILGLIILGIGYIKKRETAYEREVARIRQLGAPTNLGELNAYYHGNSKLEPLGAQLLDALAGYNPSQEFRDGIAFSKRLAIIGTHLSKEDADQLRRHLDANAQYMESLWHALYVAYESGIRYPIDLTQGYEADTAFLAKIENAERMLAAFTQLAVEDGRKKEALESIRAGLSLEESLRDIPLLLAQYYRIRCYETVHGQIEFALNTQTFSREDISGLHEHVAWISFDGVSSFGLMGDRAAFALPARNAKSYMPNVTYWRVQFQNIYFAISDLIEIGRLPMWERLESAKTFDSRLDAFYDRWGIFNSLQMLVVPHAEQTYTHENGAIATRLTAEAALEIIQFCMDHSRLPNDISELSPKYRAAAPIDPFDGQPLRYSRRGEGFVVYSVGRDLRDDDGRPRPENKIEARKSAYDIVFRVLDARPYCERR